MTAKDVIGKQYYVRKSNNYCGYSRSQTSFKLGTVIGYRESDESILVSLNDDDYDNLIESKINDAYIAKENSND